MHFVTIHCSIYVRILTFPPGLKHLGTSVSDSLWWKLRCDESQLLALFVEVVKC